MPVVKIALQPVISRMFDGDPVELITDTPTDTLDEWLTENYEPLHSFRYKADRFKNHEGRLISTNNPHLEILIQTYSITPTRPSSVFSFNRYAGLSVCKNDPRPHDYAG